jgi:hypothetical protein
MSFQKICALLFNIYATPYFQKRSLCSTHAYTELSLELSEKTWGLTYVIRSDLKNLEGIAFLENLKNSAFGLKLY